MIRNTVINSVNYLYPLGNTPPVSLTQDLPPRKDADLLLLGCGDARNVLFTCFADPGRKFDVTCCDIEPAIIARNVLLYTLLIDDAEGTRPQQIWNVYYHWKIDDESLAILESQAERLLSLSETVSVWRASTYGSTIHFCDRRTLTKIRGFWTECSSRGFSVANRSQKQSALQDTIVKARKLRQEMAGEGFSLGGTRSAAPTGILAIEDLSTITARWWKEGVTTSCTSSMLQSNHLNPAFLAVTDQRLVLHYGLEPLSGFPLATAYVPLLDDNCLYVKKGGMSSAEYLSACAYQHFQAWARAFRKTVTSGMTIRFCVADALVLSLTLQDLTPLDESVLTANIPCDNWTSEPLVLDESEYGNPKHSAPRRFDVVDTSNLIDHLGPLNILPTCATLLKHGTCSTLYTESLVQHDSSARGRVASLLGGDFRTTALLLGLSPCETWTNATDSPEDESMTETLSSQMDGKKSDSATQVRSRLRWKRTHSPSEIEFTSPMHIEAPQVARVLVKLYDHMFEHENVVSMFANLQTNTLSKRANPYYNRASFVLLLKSMQRTIATDWSQCLDLMMPQIFSGFSDSPCGANFAQELLLYMHMLKVDTSRLPTISLDTSRNAKLAPFFSSWPDVPAQVCVTVRVPRNKLQVFTSRAGMATGTPTLRCDIEGGGKISRPWSNTFASVSVAFGHTRLSQNYGVPVLRIEEDDSNWWGTSDMLLSAFVPTWTLLQPDETTPMVKCGLLPTLQSYRAFMDLGLTLDIFRAEITSADVTVSKYLPAMSGLPKLIPKEPSTHGDLHKTVTAKFSSTDTVIKTLTHRISYSSVAEKAKLRDRSVVVQVHFQDTFRASIKIGNEPESPAHFPIPVNYLQHKVRIARKSSYIEIEAPPWDPLTETSIPLLFPMIQLEGSDRQPSEPVPWTATQMKLDTLPIINTKAKQKLKWLVTHTSMMFSTRERQVREDGMAGRTRSGMKPNLRVEMKDGLFTMLMNYTGLQGKHARVFGLSKEVGGINVLFLVSSLRLDVVNRTVVLDAAVVPLTNKMNSDGQVGSFYRSLTTEGVMQINVGDDELRAWKSVLPALTERCRLWEHKANCEYASTGGAPIKKGLEDGYSPLCSCGIGKFPTAYLQDFSQNALQHVLKRYATRVAISPFFAVPYVEDCFLAGVSLPETQRPTSSTRPECGNCGKDKRHDTDAIKKQLLVCSRCHERKYCSTECQRADWKNHKVFCSSA